MWTTEEDMKVVIDGNPKLNDDELASLCMKLIYRLDDRMCVSKGHVFQMVRKKIIELKGKTMNDITKNPSDLMFSKKELFSLYKAPFTYDGIMYIWDADKSMVMDFGDFKNKPTPIGGGARVRGWGRIKYMRSPGPLFGTLEQFLLEVIKNCNDDPNQCVDALNKAWSEIK